VADKYSKAVRALAAEGQRIGFYQAVLNAWATKTGRDQTPGCELFQYCTPTGELISVPGQPVYGCLTQVRSGMFPAYNVELTEEIRADERLPMNPLQIKPETLFVLAEWQRKLDEILRKPSGKRSRADKESPVVQEIV